MNVYYFLGIGGIGMSAIARYFHLQGHKVLGYDRTPTELTIELEKEGIEITYQDDIAFLPKKVDLVIYTPAIPKDNKLFIYCKENELPLKKRSQILGELTRGKKCIAVAGTHGKTTVSTMIAHLLYNSKVGCSAFLGGISKNFGTNYVVDVKSDFVVVEADEYDRSFLQLTPYYAAITSIDADHLDIYGSHHELKKSFVEFAQKLESGNKFLESGYNFQDPHSKKLDPCSKNPKLFIKDSIDLEIDPQIIKTTYTIKDIEADYYAWNIRNYKGSYYFDLRTPERIIYDICLNYPGIHNIENAVLAMTIALECGVDEQELREGISTFSGVKRRFDIRIKQDDFVYIDDYAHHPQELISCIDSVRDLYPNKKITGIFQPHLYSRTRDFVDEFADALQRLDEIILIDIYPAREEPIEGVSSKMILHKINKMDKYYTSKDGLFELLDALYPQVLLTLGAGDIDKLVKPIEEHFFNK